MFFFFQPDVLYQQLKMLVKVIHIHDFVRGRQFPHITFYGEVQEQPMQLQSDCAKFIFSGLIATYDRSNHRRQCSDDEAMYFFTDECEKLWLELCYYRGLWHTKCCTFA
jgi:hypothetical protein